MRWEFCFRGLSLAYLSIHDDIHHRGVVGSQAQAMHHYIGLDKYFEMSSVMYDESGERDRDWFNVLFGTGFICFVNHYCSYAKGCSTYSRVKQAKEKTNVCVGNFHRKELRPSSSTCL